MKTPKNKLFQKIILILLIFSSTHHLSISQTTCGAAIEIRDNITLCQGETYQFGTKLITSTGLYIQTFKTISTNCDSIVTLGVNYLNNSNFSFTESITTNENYLFNGISLTEPGIYKDTLIDGNGCDSVLTLTLDVIVEKENCANGVDDDGDGLIDAFDNDCLCLINGTTIDLIPNGGFEEKVGCCRGFSGNESMCVDNWVNLSGSSHVYHNPDCWAVLGQELATEGINLESGLMSGQIGTNGTGTISGMSLGICLDEPMFAGNTYTLSFDIGRSFLTNTFRPFPENMNFTVNGIAECESLNDYIFNQDFCQRNLPFEQLTMIKLANLVPKWNHFEFEITPSTTIEAIFLGGNCDDDLPPFRSAQIFYDNFSIISTDGLRIKNEINIVGNSCQGDPQLFIPNTDNFVIDWYKDSILLPQTTGRPFVITEEIAPITSGMYHAKVNFEDGRCQLLGPLEIETFDLNLPKDTLLCPDQNIVLNIAEIGVQLEWQDGSTASTFPVSEAGLYWVEGRKGDCVIRDSMTVGIKDAPSFLPKDTFLCNERDFLIKPLPPYKDIVWVESANAIDSLLVTESGVYHAILFGECQWEDNIAIQFQETTIDLPSDTTLCDANEFLIDVGPISGQLTWQDGSTDQEFLVTESGTYSLELTDGFCQVRDSIAVAIGPMAIDLGRDTMLCENETLNLVLDIPNVTFEWQDGSTNPDLTISKTGNYWVIVNENNCLA